MFHRFFLNGHHDKKKVETFISLWVRNFLHINISWKILTVPSPISKKRQQTRFHNNFIIRPCLYVQELRLRLFSNNMEMDMDLTKFWIGIDKYIQLLHCRSMMRLVMKNFYWNIDVRKYHGTACRQVSAWLTKFKYLMSTFSVETLCVQVRRVAMAIEYRKVLELSI